MSEENIEKFLNGVPIEFISGEWTWIGSARRITSKGVALTKSVSQYLPLGAVPKYMTTLHVLLQLGARDVMESVSLLVKLVKALDSRSLGFGILPILPLGLYYTMAENVGVRGDNPEAEFQEHLKSRTSDNFVVSTDLKIACSLAVNVGYIDSVRGIQSRLHNLFGLALIMIDTDEDGRVLWFLAGSKISKTVYLVIPGTRTMADVSSDLDAIAAIGSDGKFHAGIKKVADRIETVVAPHVARLDSAGYKLILTGHSLGGGVAAVLALGLKKRVTRMKCFAFGPPPCMEESLAESANQFVTSVVLRHDLVTRASVQNVDLLVHTLNNSRTKFWNFFILDCKRIARWRPWGVDGVENEPPTEPSRIEPRSSFFSKFYKTFFSRERAARDFFLPGNILHIYSRYGIFHAGYVSRSHPSLNRIEISPSMIRDHLGEQYFRAMAEIGTDQPPCIWKRFKDCNLCGCCRRAFGRGKILSGSPHINLYKRTCRKCGDVVCESCSANNRPLDGMIRPVRHCDRCVIGISRL
jgi:pimeloyl-ACP methyl ester carboxylesterase